MRGGPKAFIELMIANLLSRLLLVSWIIILHLLAAELLMQRTSVLGQWL
jgi:hypothetical protein